MELLLSKWFNFFVLLAQIVTSSPEKGKSTIFGTPGDRFAGGAAACTGKLPSAHKTGVAHRTLKCGTNVLLYNPRTGKAVIAPIVDRGPFGALDEDGHWFVKRPGDSHGKYRGIADLLPGTAKALGHNGMEAIYLTPLK